MLYYKKKNNALIHYRLTFLSVPIPCPSQGPFCFRVSALTEPVARKLTLPGLCTMGVLSHHLGPSSNAMNILKRPFLVPPTQPVFIPLTCFISLMPLLMSWNHFDSFMYISFWSTKTLPLIHCCSPGTWKCTWQIYPTDLKLVSTQEPAANVYTRFIHNRPNLEAAQMSFEVGGESLDSSSSIDQAHPRPRRRQSLIRQCPAPRNKGCKKNQITDSRDFWNEVNYLLPPVRSHI